MQLPFDFWKPHASFNLKTRNYLLHSGFLLNSKYDFKIKS